MSVNSLILPLQTEKLKKLKCETGTYSLQFELRDSSEGVICCVSKTVLVFSLPDFLYQSVLGKLLQVVHHRAVGHP